MNYEIALNITEEKRLDEVILFLVANGYNVYVNNDDKNFIKLCFTAPEEEVQKIEYEKKKVAK